jgi:tetratricopeptide (TPR) repeat protein
VGGSISSLVAPTGGPTAIADWRIAAVARWADEGRLTEPARSARLLRRVVDELPRHDPRRGGLLHRLADAELFSGRLREAESIARTGLGCGPLDGDVERGLVYVLGQSLFLQGRLAEAAEHFGEAKGPSGAAGDPMVLVDMASTHLLAGELEPAKVAAEHALLRARVAADVVAEVAALAALSSVIGVAGDVRAAVDCGRAAMARADNGGVAEAHRNAPYLFLAAALLWADQIEECRETLERAPSSAGGWRWDGTSRCAWPPWPTCCTAWVSGTPRRRSPSAGSASRWIVAPASATCGCAPSWPGSTSTAASSIERPTRSPPPTSWLPAVPPGSSVSCSCTPCTPRRRAGSTAPRRRWPSSGASWSGAASR